MKAREHWILEGHKAVPTDLLTWGRWLEEHQDERIVAQTECANGKWVSTVFIGIGLDHNWNDGPPHIFETMVFTSRSNYDEEYCERYSTWEEAQAGHLRAIAIATGAKHG